MQGLSGIDLDVYEGEFLVLVGPNGSGKSTLARHLNALLIPSEGEVLIQGSSLKTAEDRYEIKQLVGLAFQNPDNQLVAPLVQEDVAFGPENLGLSPVETRERVARALETVGLSERASDNPANLSGGEKQRLAIAGLLAMEPRCLVLDEVTALLDGSGRREVIDLVCRLNREIGVTVVLITHFMEEAVIGDRVIALKDGRIAFEGTPEELFSGNMNLHELGLHPPKPVIMRQLLKSQGLPLKGAALTTEGLAEDIIDLWWGENVASCN